MKRILSLVVLLLVSFVGFAQAPTNYTNINGRYRWIAGMFDSTFSLPKGATPSLRTGGSSNPGALFYRTTDSTVKYWTGTQWLTLSDSTRYVPYTGATKNVNLGQYGMTTKWLQFDTSSQAVTDRRLQWSNDDGTLQFGMTNGSTITQRIGLEQFARVKNVDASQINKGDVVYLYGASGDRAAVKKADNRNDSTSSKTLGVATEDIPVDSVGFVGTFGVVGKLNLSAFSPGDILYLDSIPGKMTKTKPQAPYHLVFIGVVERANAGNGLLFTNVQNGYELEELHNVRITSPVNNRAILAYDSVAKLWKDTTLNAIGGITGNLVSGYLTKATGANTIDTSQIFQSAGLIGISTTSPQYTLDVNGSINSTSLIRISPSTATNNAFLSSINTGGTAYFGLDNSTGTLTSAYSLNVYHSGAYPIIFSTNSTQRMRITSAGLVGIGTATPQSIFDITAATPIMTISATTNTVLHGIEWKAANSLDAFIKQQPNTGEFRISNGRSAGWGGFITFYTDVSERMRISSTGSVGIGTTSLTGYNLRVSKSVTGATTAYGISSEGQIESDVTSSARYFTTNATQAAGSTLTTLYHYNATQGTISGTITDQYGYFVQSNLTSATNNYGFYGNIGAGLGRWNLYMAGTANNHMGGSLAIGTTSIIGYNLNVNKNLTGAVDAFGIQSAGQIQSDVTSSANYFQSNASQASGFTISNIRHYAANQGTISGTVTNQYGFSVSSDLTGATNNYGFFGNIASGTGRWNLYMNGTAVNYLAGNTGIGITSPNVELAVYNSTTPRLHLQNSTSGTTSGDGLQLTLNGSDGYIWNFENGAIVLATNNIERIRIPSNGEVLINTTSDAGDYKLQVNGNVYAAGSFAINTSGQTRTITTFYGTGSNGQNIFIGGGGLSSGTGGGSSFLGSNNSSLGVDALLSNTTGYSNSAVGLSALYSNTTGFNNSAVGRNTLYINTTGYSNSAMGFGALYSNTTGYNNSAYGTTALYSNTTGYNNSAIGVEAGRYINAGTANETSNNSVYLGYDTRASASGNTNEIVIGSGARGDGSNTIRLGNTSITAVATSGSIKTGAPTAGTATAWKLGEAATVSPTSPNRTIRVEIDGVVYYIAAKTTND